MNTLVLTISPVKLANDRDAYSFAMLRVGDALDPGTTVLSCRVCTDNFERERIRSTFASRADMLVRPVTRFRESGCWKRVFRSCAAPGSAPAYFKHLIAFIDITREYTRAGYPEYHTVRQELHAIAREHDQMLPEDSTVLTDEDKTRIITGHSNFQTLSARLFECKRKSFAINREFRIVRLQEILDDVYRCENSLSFGDIALEELLRSKGIARHTAMGWLVHRF